MRIAVTALLVYGLLILGAGFAAYLSAESTVSLVSAVFLSAILLSLAYRADKGSVPAGYVGGICVFLLAVYFAYRFISSERFVPSGVLLIVSFLALFGVILGVFLSLRDRL